MVFRKKDWVLTEDAFSNLLAHFDQEPVRAAEKYEITRAELTRLFRYRGCNSPYELADEVINRVARKFEEGEIIPPQELSNYFYGVARNVLREYLRSPESSASSVEELSPSNHPSENPEAMMEIDEARQRAELRSSCLERCLGKLPPETRKLIISYYEGDEGAKIKNRQRLARQLNVSLNSLRIRLHRVRERLEKCVTECINYENVR